MYWLNILNFLFFFFIFFFCLMIRLPPRSTLDRSSAASDVYKRQDGELTDLEIKLTGIMNRVESANAELIGALKLQEIAKTLKDQELAPGIHLVRKAMPDISTCLLYTSPSPRDRTRSRMPSSA